MIKDFSIGTILYVLVSVFFGYPFHIHFYLLSLIISILPDLDFILYLFFKKRLSLVTHRLIHYPLFFLCVGTVISTLSPYFGMLFLTLIFSHFVLDTFAETQYPTGIQWLYPFSKKSWYILKRKVYQLTLLQQTQQLEKRKVAWDADKKKRTTLWEIAVRMDAFTLGNIILVFSAFILLAIFSLGRL